MPDAQEVAGQSVMGTIAYIRAWLAQRLASTRRASHFKAQFEAFSRLSVGNGCMPTPTWEDRYPCLDDATTTTGFDRHYIYHPAWAARVLSRTRPEKHIDISSTLHFCSIVSAFVPTEFFDFRPAPLVLDGLACRAANLTALDWQPDSVASLSCMHVIEHVGLGRYGDPIDPSGDLKAIRELARVLAPGGDLLIAVPVGRARTCFNAHRIYDKDVFVGLFEGLELVEFALIPDGDAPGGLVFDASSELVNSQNYGCGCFWFRKPMNRHA